MLDLLEGETVSILSKQQADWAGDGEFTFSHTVEDVLFEDVSMSSDNDRRDDYVVTGYVYMPLGSIVSATDRIEREGGQIVRILGRPRPVELGLVSGIKFRYQEVN